MCGQHYRVTVTVRILSDNFSYHVKKLPCKMCEMFVSFLVNVHNRNSTMQMASYICQSCNSESTVKHCGDEAIEKSVR